MIHWISPTLGTAPFAEGVSTAGVVVVDVRNLLDRAGNDAGTIRGHVDAAHSAHVRGERVLVCCDHGISRSNAIAIAVLAAVRGVSFDAALATVLAAANQPEVRVEVLAEVRAACNGNDARTSGGARRVLLTGGTGGLGRLLLRTLPAGFEAWTPDKTELDLQHGPAPIDAYMRRHGIQRVMHFAQPHSTNINRSLGDALAMLRNVLDAAAAQGSTVFFPSNWLVYAGYADHELLVGEEAPTQPATCLGDTKVLCEQLLAQYVLRQGLATTVLRSGPVVGAGIAPAFVRNLRQLAAAGADLSTHRYDNGRPALDFVSADDYAAAAWGLVETGSTGTFHAGGGTLTSTQHTAELIAAALGSPSRRSETRVHGTTCNVRLDSSKLTQTIGWLPKTGATKAISRFALDPAPSAGNTPSQEEQT